MKTYRIAAIPGDGIVTTTSAATHEYRDVTWDKMLVVAIRDGGQSRDTADRTG